MWLPINVRQWLYMDCFRHHTATYWSKIVDFLCPTPHLYSAPSPAECGPVWMSLKTTMTVLTGGERISAICQPFSCITGSWLTDWRLATAWSALYIASRGLLLALLLFSLTYTSLILMSFTCICSGIRDVQETFAVAYSARERIERKTSTPCHLVRTRLPYMHIRYFRLFLLFCGCNWLHFA